MDAATHDLYLAVDGDDEAFSRLVLATATDVRRFCRWQVGATHEVDDLVQETFLRAYRGLPTYRNEAPARVWLLSIARRVCLDSFEKTARHERMVRRIGRRPSLVESTDEVTNVSLLVAQLPELYREAFILVRLLGYRYDEAAQILGCPRGTIQSRVARARETLAGLVTDGRTAEIRSNRA